MPFATDAQVEAHRAHPLHLLVHLGQPGTNFAIGVYGTRRTLVSTAATTSTIDGRRAATAADRSAAFAERLAGLREQHRRRPTLIAMLDEAGLR